MPNAGTFQGLTAFIRRHEVTFWAAIMVVALGLLFLAPGNITRDIKDSALAKVGVLLAFMWASNMLGKI